MSAVTVLWAAWFDSGYIYIRQSRWPVDRLTATCGTQLDHRVVAVTALPFSGAHSNVRYVLDHGVLAVDCTMENLRPHLRARRQLQTERLFADSLHNKLTW